MSTEESTQTEFVHVGVRGDFEEGVLYNRKIELSYVAVVRRGDRFYAMRNACTHAGFFLTPGTLHDDLVHCPAHGAWFRLEDGVPTDGPADDPLELWQTRVEGDDVLVAPPR